MSGSPSRWWHVLSAGILLGVGMGAPIVTVLLVVSHLSSGDEFVVPGTHKLDLKRSGKYVVWNTVSQFRDGEQRQFPCSLPAGARITIIAAESGKEVPTQGTMSCTERSGSTERVSLCSFRIAAPGSYSVVVDGASEQRLLMVRRSMLPALVWLFFLGGSVSVLGWTLPLLISIVVEVKRFAGQGVRTTG